MTADIHSYTLAVSPNWQEKMAAITMETSRQPLSCQRSLCQGSQAQQGDSTDPQTRTQTLRPVRRTWSRSQEELQDSARKVKVYTSSRWSVHQPTGVRRSSRHCELVGTSWQGVDGTKHPAGVLELVLNPGGGSLFQHH